MHKNPNKYRLTMKRKHLIKNMCSNESVLSGFSQLTSDTINTINGKKPKDSRFDVLNQEGIEEIEDSINSSEEKHNSQNKKNDKAIQRHYNAQADWQVTILKL